MRFVGVVALLLSLALGLAAEPHAAGAVEASKVGDQLSDWLAGSGGFFDREALVLTELGEGKGRGFVSQVDIEQGQILAEIPASLMFTEKSALRTLPDYLFPTPEDEHKALELLYRMPLTNAMAVMLLCHREMGDSSPFHAYISSLPPVAIDSITSTLGFTDEQLELLQGSSLLELSKKRNEAIERFWSSLSPPWNRFSLVEFKWALFMLWSRTISVKIDAEAEGALVPIADLFNAGLSSPVKGQMKKCRAAPETTCLRYRTTQHIPADSHVVMLYGTEKQQSSAELLFFYGFVLPDNPYDVIRLPIECPRNPSRTAKKRILQQLSLDKYELTITGRTAEIPQDMLFVASVCSLTADETGRWQQLLRKEPPAELAYRAQSFIRQLIDDKLSGYTSTLLQDQEEFALLTNPSTVRGNILSVLIAEKTLLQRFRSLID